MNKGGLGPPFVVLRRQALYRGLVLTLGCVGAWAQSASVVVYRCPGPPVLYTDALTMEQAQAQQCRPIEGAPLNAGVAPTRSTSRPKASSAGSAASVPMSSASVSTAESMTLQREREVQALRILQAELSREEQRLEALRLEFNRSRVESLKASIGRKEADIAALRREIASRAAR